MGETTNAKPTYLDPTYPVGERVEDLLGRMTLDEKIAQLGSVEPYEDMTYSEEKTKSRMKNGIGEITLIGGNSTLNPRERAEFTNGLQAFLLKETRLGIPAIVHEECCAGYMAAGATCFPQMIGAASTWEPALLEEMTSVIRTQMRSVGAHQGLSPVLDVARDPRWGRTEETFGEDPYLASRMGVAYVRGLQGPDLKQGIVATGKHFVGYALSEGGMNMAPVHLGQRELREVFLVPFEAAVKEAKVASIMNAYHELDGVPCTCSEELLTKILRHQWGFGGIVVSDYHSIPMLAQYHYVAKDISVAAAMALRAGIDVELPHTFCYGQPLHKAIQDGIIEESWVDQAVRRVLKMKFALGLFENPYVDVEKVGELFDTVKQRALARRAALNSMVLLKNERELLPLEKNLLSIAVIGPNAHTARNMLADYSHAARVDVHKEMHGNPDLTGAEKMTLEQDYISVPITSVLENIKRRVSQGTRVYYAKGCDITGDSRDGLAEAVEIARKSQVAVVVVGDKSGLATTCTSGEFRDRAELGLPGVQEDLVRAVYETGTPVVVVLINGRPLSIPWIAEHVPAILEAWLPGEEGGAAVACVLFGDYNPGGKLPVTLLRGVGQIPLYYNHKPSGGRSAIYGDYLDMSCQPVFAFGHGLSYTEFKIDNLRIDPKRVRARGEVKISVDVENLGDRAGEEVVQLYVHCPLSSVTRRVKELKGFKRVALEPNQKQTVTFTLFISQLGFYDKGMKYVVEPGTVEVMVGSSSDDIRASGEFEIVGKRADVSSDKKFFSTVTVE